MRPTTTWISTLATLCTFAATAQAAVPERMHYQGYLTNAVGEAVHCPDAAACPDQSFAITFRLYDTAEGGEPIWVETHADVSVVRGTFNVGLGTVTALDPAALTDPAWLGMELNDTGEMTPRQRLVSAAFALRAGNAESAEVASLADDADRLGGLDAADYARLSDLEGLCVTDDELTQVLTEESYLDQGDLEGYLTESGYVAGAHFSGHFDDLTGVPQDLLDGDDDLLAMMNCESGDIARFDGLSWSCDLDRVLTEGEVDQMVSNNGYAQSELLAEVATSGLFGDLTGVPAGLADGDDDTTYQAGSGLSLDEANSLALSEEGCQAGFVLKRNEANDGWACVPDADSQNVYDGTNFATSGQACELGQVVTGISADGSVTCAADAVLTEAQVEDAVTNGGLDLHSATSIGGDQPALLNADNSLTVAGTLESTVGGVRFPDGTTQTTAVASNAGSGGTVIYTRCAWTGPNAKTIGSCTPPACPADWADLGNTGRVKTTVAMMSTDTNGNHWSESGGYEERACYVADTFAVIVTRCAWTGPNAKTIGSCTPPACPADWADLGKTGGVKTATGMHNRDDYNDVNTESGGYDERACYAADTFAVVVTRCGWTGPNAKTIGSCTPPACPADWADLGKTGGVKTTIAMTARDDYNDVYTESGGYDERTCVK